MVVDDDAEYNLSIASSIDYMKQWTEQHEKLLNNWRMKLYAQMWLQHKSMYYFNSVNNWLTYPTIIISSLSSATLFSTNSAAAKYTIGALSLATAIITGLTRHIKPAERTQQHATALLQYQEMIHTITTCLNLPMDMREEPQLFIRDIETKMKTWNEKQAMPPPHIVALFERQYGEIDKILYDRQMLEIIQEMNRPRPTIREFFSQPFRTREIRNSTAPAAVTSTLPIAPTQLHRRRTPSPSLSEDSPRESWRSQYGV
jgi:hypothetical protein